MITKRLFVLQKKVNLANQFMLSPYRCTLYFDYDPLPEGVVLKWKSSGAALPDTPIFPGKILSTVGWNTVESFSVEVDSDVYDGGARTLIIYIVAVEPANRRFSYYAMINTEGNVVEAAITVNIAAQPAALALGLFETRVAWPTLAVIPTPWYVPASPVRLYSQMRFAITGTVEVLEGPYPITSVNKVFTVTSISQGIRKPRLVSEPLDTFSNPKDITATLAFDAPVTEPGVYPISGYLYIEMERKEDVSSESYYKYFSVEENITIKVKDGAVLGTKAFRMIGDYQEAGILYVTSDDGEEGSHTFNTCDLYGYLNNFKDFPYMQIAGMQPGDVVVVDGVTYTEDIEFKLTTHQPVVSWVFPPPPYSNSFNLTIYGHRENNLEAPNAANQIGYRGTANFTFEPFIL